MKRVLMMVALFGAAAAAADPGAGRVGVFAIEEILGRKAVGTGSVLP